MMYIAVLDGGVTMNPSVVAMKHRLHITLIAPGTQVLPEVLLSAAS